MPPPTSTSAHSITTGRTTTSPRSTTARPSNPIRATPWPTSTWAMCSTRPAGCRKPFRPTRPPCNWRPPTPTRTTTSHSLSRSGNSRARPCPTGAPTCVWTPPAPGRFTPATRSSASCKVRGCGSSTASLRNRSAGAPGGPGGVHALRILCNLTPTASQGPSCNRTRPRSKWFFLRAAPSPLSHARPVLKSQVCHSCSEGIRMAEIAAPLAHPSPLTALTEDEVLFRDNVRQFAEERVRPLAREMDEKGVFEKDLIHQFFQLGLMGIEIPEQYGGGGGSFFEAILAVEELSRADASAGVIVDVQNTLVNNALLRWSSEEQRKRYLPRMVADTVGAYALSEAGSGSDAFALQTKAELKGSDYVLNGRKLWITNGKEAGLFILFATVDPAAGYKGITAFIIEKDFPGFTVGKKEDKLGIRASSTCELILEDCRVPKANVLGEVGKGYKIAIETLNEGRIGIGAQMLGVARGAWEYASKYAQERKQFGRPLSDFQGIQFQIAQMATEIEAARLMVYNAARMKDAGANFVKEAAMTKLFCSQVAERVTSLAVEIYGGYGFTKDYPVEKYWRDSKIGKIYEGTSNMQLQTIDKLVMSK